MLQSQLAGVITQKAGDSSPPARSLRAVDGVVRSLLARWEATVVLGISTSSPSRTAYVGRVDLVLPVHVLGQLALLLEAPKSAFPQSYLAPPDRLHEAVLDVVEQLRRQPGNESFGTLTKAVAGS